MRFLFEARRVLRSGGVLRVCVPSIERLDPAHGLDIVWGHGHQGVYTMETLYHMLRLAGFSPSAIRFTDRAPEDGHFRVIGEEKDSLETIRAEATK